MHTDKNDASSLISTLNWEIIDKQGRSTLPVQNKLLLNENLIFWKLEINNVPNSLWALPFFREIMIKKQNPFEKLSHNTTAPVLKHEMSLSEAVKTKQKPISHLANDSQDLWNFPFFIIDYY